MSLKQLAKGLAVKALLPFAKHLNKGASILLYHSIGENQKFSTVRPGVFEQQLQLLQESGREVMSLKFLIERIRRREQCQNKVALTFDDGFEDFYNNAFPLLKKYGVHATVFIITDFIGKPFTTKQGERFQIVSESQVREMVASGLVDCMPHSATHPKFATLDVRTAQHEISASRERIEAIINEEAAIFAYPYGGYTDEVVEYLSANSWLGAVTVKRGIVSARSDLMLLPRNQIDSTTSLDLFRIRISDKAAWKI